MRQPDLLLYGSGHVAHHLAFRFREVGISMAIHARESEHAFKLAEALQLTLNEPYSPRVVLLAVSDRALPIVAAQLLKEQQEWGSALWLHTSGSQSVEVLPASRRGVLYPLQTFHRNKPALDWSQVPVLIEASAADQAELLALAHRLSPQVQELDSEGRLRLHLSAVFACNFSNYCYTIAAQLMQQNGLDFRLLQPLLEETLTKALAIGPKDAQTGPAIRGDETVINKHLELLKPTPELAELYRILSESIQRG